MNSDDQADNRGENPRGRGGASKRNRRALTSIDSVLTRVVSTMGLEKRLKEHTLCNLWPTLIGDQFAQKSRPLFIDHEGSLVIAVKDASVGQELSLLKPEILKKVRVAAHSLGLTVSGMRFDLKHFHGGTQPLNESAYLTDRLCGPMPEPSRDQLIAINLSETDLSQLAELKAKLPLENASNLNERICSLFEQELKLRHWRHKQGFPVCPSCSCSTQSLHGPDALCRDCYFAALSHVRDI